MKKTLKIFAFALAILPMGLLTACGGGQLDFNPNVNVNNAGTYSASTKEDFNEVVIDETTNENVDFSSYRMYMKMETKSKTIGNQTIPAMTILTTGIYKINADGKLEMAIKNSTKTKDQTTDLEFYMPAGDYIYANMKMDSKAIDLDKKFRLPAEELSAVNNSTSNGEDVSFADILDEVQDADSGITFEKATSGERTNFKITIEAGEDDVVVYFLFENNEIVACQYNVGSLLELKIEKYDGNIDFPSFGSEYLAIDDFSDMFDII